MRHLPTLDEPTGVMLVDDHAVVREGYRRLLALETDIVVTGDYANVEEVLAALQVDAVSTQVLVMDLSMPGRDGMELLRRVRLWWPALQVLVFSMHDSPALVLKALRNGAMGYITKSSPPQDLVAAVRHAARGQMVLSSDVANVVGGHAGPQQAAQWRAATDDLQGLLAG